MAMCSILLFLSSFGLLAILAFGDTGLKVHLVQMNPYALYGEILATFIAGLGYWTLKRWGVVLYAITVVLAWVGGATDVELVIPGIIVLTGLSKFPDLTWR